MGGAALGVAITKTLRHVGLEVYDRIMVRRQQERVGLVLGVAGADAERLGLEGNRLREDGFFDSNRGTRSDAEELLEGLLLEAANAYQERKLRHLGAILPSLAVRPDISAADGHWFMRMAERLSWRQLVVVSIFISPPEQALLRRDVDQNETGQRGPSPGLAEEVEELGTLGLIGVRASDENVVRAGATFGSSGTIWGASMAQWALTRQGRLLAEIARLDDVPRRDYEDVLADLLA
jgi:hypothetical protein